MAEVAEVKEVKSKEVKSAKKLDFYSGTGRRKTTVARVRLILGKGEILINDLPLDKFFKEPIRKMIVEEPLKIVDRLGTFSGTVKLSGGGTMAQAGAVSLGMARALVAYDETLRVPLAKAGLMTRDPRMKERRKYGLGGKARRGKQSPKR